jgi:hypothetical protein
MRLLTDLRLGAHGIVGKKGRMKQGSIKDKLLP